MVCFSREYLCKLKRDSRERSALIKTIIHLKEFSNYILLCTYGKNFIVACAGVAFIKIFH
jgi:hypothetical protein